MTFEVIEPVLIIGLGGVGSKLVTDMKESIGADCIRISNDRKDLHENDSIEISTKSIINPSVQLIRGSAMECSDDISKSISNYKTIIIMANLAGKLVLQYHLLSHLSVRSKTRMFCLSLSCHSNLKKIEFFNLEYH